MLNKINRLLIRWPSGRVFGQTCVASMSTISNKRITRLTTDTEVSKSELKTEGNEALVNTRLVNRNPRNLEQMLYEYKPLGWELDQPERTFYNKIVFENVGKHLLAKIVHNSGRAVVSASTKEIAISHQLKSTGGVNAAIGLGKVLAIRALESGITQVFVGSEYQSDNSQKAKAFLESVSESGLVLEEQPFIFRRSRRDP